MSVNRVYGLVAEFDDADALVSAARHMHEAGYTRAEAFSPYPLPEAAHALGIRRNAVVPVVFICGLVGGVAGFALQYWTMAVDYPINVGGRPLNSWPVFIPITFEMTVLIAAVGGFVGLLALCGLPRFNHPLFEVKRFTRNSSSAFFLCVSADDPRYDPAATRSELERLSPTAVEEVRA